MSPLAEQLGSLSALRLQSLVFMGSQDEKRTPGDEEMGNTRSA